MVVYAKSYDLLCRNLYPGSPPLQRLWDRGPNANNSRTGVIGKRVVTIRTRKKDDIEPGLTGIYAYKGTQELDVNDNVEEAATPTVGHLQSEQGAVNGWNIQPETASGTAENQDRRAMGRLLLLLVAVLWGTYSPAMKYMYSLPGRPTPVVLTALKAVIAALALLFSSMIVAFNKRQKGETLGELANEDSVRVGRNTVSGVNDSRKMFPRFNSSLVRCGIELGLWSLLGTASHAIGLQYTTATQGAFLIQSTALFTPVIAAAAGNTLSTSNWIGCFVGLLGSVVITLETTKSVELGSTGLAGLTGDTFVLGAAFIYALSTVRLGALALRFRAMDLATAKTVTLAVFAVLWAMWGNGGFFTGGESLSSVLEVFSTWPSFLVLIWTAIGPGAIASFLQTKGQQCLGPAESQVLFASTPFWSALFAWLFLSEGEMGMLGWVGGCIIIVAGIFSSSDGKQRAPKRT